MLAILSAIIVGATTGIMIYRETGLGWGITAGVLAFGIIYILIGLLVFAKVKKINKAIQELMQTASQKLNRRMQQLQMKPQGGVKSMQKTLEKEQNKALAEAIEMTKAAEPLFSWNLMLKKQISTMRMMFHYQMKNFEQVDLLMPHCMIFSDPRALSMKIARQFVKKDPELENSIKKLKRFKGDQAASLYALVSWVLVKQGKIDEAVKLLVEAKSKCDNEVINKNWEALVNGNVKKFSNAGLGDEWYALYLEEARMKTKKARRGGFR
jgi:predicted S18 family serine protease